MGFILILPFKYIMYLDHIYSAITLPSPYCSNLVLYILYIGIACRKFYIFLVYDCIR